MIPVSPTSSAALSPFIVRNPWGAVIVAPGGSYAYHAPHEGPVVAEWLNSIGLSAFVLEYRLGPENRHPAMLHDAQAAIAALRRESSELGLESERLAMLGFSAGGHLTALCSVSNGPRPDLSLLVYPVISMLLPLAHSESTSNLLGDQVSDADRASVSPQLFVDTLCPPAFLVHGMNDQPVPPEHSLVFAAALRKAGVGCEIHLFEDGEHGFGLGRAGESTELWPVLAEKWLRSHWM